MSMEDWVRDNRERVQELRDKASANYHITSARRKEKRDGTSHTREVRESGTGPLA